MMTSADEERFFDKVDAGPGGGCHMWAAYRGGTGYGVFRMKGELKRAHRVSWTIHNGPIPDGLHVLHRCDRPGCVNPEHLFLGTHLDNMRDREAKGRNRPPRGEANPNSKLNVETVLAIRADARRYLDIAASHGISYQQVKNIKDRKQWAHV